MFPSIPKVNKQIDVARPNNGIFRLSCDLYKLQSIYLVSFSYNSNTKVYKATSKINLIDLDFRKGIGVVGVADIGRSKAIWRNNITKNGIVDSRFN